MREETICALAWYWLRMPTRLGCCTLEEARICIMHQKEDYNTHRPHSALGNIPPAEFAVRIRLENQAA